MTRRDLPMADPCGGCGRCCESIGLPPFEAANPDYGPQPVHLRGLTATQMDDAAFDTELFLTMPPGLRTAHAELLIELHADPSGLPCVWYDASRKQCLHYDWRPATCRRFEAGDERCLSLRTEANTVMHWQGDTGVPAWLNPRG